VSICFYRLNTVELYVSLREEWSEVSKGNSLVWGFEAVMMGTWAKSWDEPVRWFEYRL
jgi:hypothetical protein